MQHHFIANASVPSTSGRTIAVIDPSDGQPFDEIPRGTAEDIDAAVHAARQCWRAVWHKTSAADRGRLLMRLSHKVLEHADHAVVLQKGTVVLQGASAALRDDAALAEFLGV